MSNFSLDRMIYGTLWALFDFKLCDDDNDDEENFYFQERENLIFKVALETKRKVHFG